MPGALPCAQAPRAQAGLCVSGSRARCGGGWLVLVVITGEDGVFTQVCLTTAEARRRAAELTDMCDVLEGKVW